MGRRVVDLGLEFSLPRAAVRNKSSSSILLVALLSLGACITNSEVGKFYSPAGGDGGTSDPSSTSDAGAAHSGGASDAATTNTIDPRPLVPAQARIAAGAASTCAIDASGEVICWGDNVHGQLGATGSSQYAASEVPWVVQGLDIGIDAVFGGSFAHCALKKDGHVVCWGDSVYERAAPGTAMKAATTYAPREAPALSQVATVAIGAYFQCALTLAKSAKCYGLNSAGQLGDRSRNDSDTPVDVSGMGGPVRAISAAQSGYFACAIASNGGGDGGAVKCWGANGHGQLGNGSTDDATEAESVIGLGLSFEDGNVTAIATGSDHACAVVAGSVLCWGSNTTGQLGDGTTEERTRPTLVSGLPRMLTLTAGTGHTCALSEAGAVYCWGNYDGDTGSLTPDIVISGAIVEITAGSRHTCALSAGGTLRCWGADERYQLGPFYGKGTQL